jgi:uncharacterized low-complexity protein
MTIPNFDSEETIMPKKIITSAAAIVGAALVGSLTAINVASAAENPFAAKSLDSGYMQLAEAEGDKQGGEGEEKSKGTSGEGKEQSEGTYGKDMETMEGKCGEGKCGGAK